MDRHHHLAPPRETGDWSTRQCHAVGSNDRARAHPALMKRRPRQEAGAALMLALWALFVLSAMVIAWALDINAQLTQNGDASRVLEAEAMACSGGEIALHPAVNSGSPVLRGGVSRQQTYEARITGEGGRLNLNWVMAGENPDRLELLRKYLET